MKKLILCFFALFCFSYSATAQKESKEVQMIRNVAAFESQDFKIVLDRWVNYPNDIGAKQDIMRNVKIEFTKEGVNINIPVLNRIVDQPYSINKGGAFKIFEFDKAKYEIVKIGYNKSRSTYKAYVKIFDPKEQGMTLEFVFYKNGSIQITANATNFERTIFGGFIIPTILD